MRVRDIGVVARRCCSCGIIRTRGKGPIFWILLVGIVPPFCRTKILVSTEKFLAITSITRR